MQDPAPAPNLQPPALARGLDLTPWKTLRVAVSGDVALNRLETRLIDTADFQRLRQIRQLGTTYLVYPTALHTRFDHALGVLALTDRMIRTIRENVKIPAEERAISPEQEQLARLLALLHDITHIPFGHTIEDEFRLLPRHDGNRRRIERFLGEGSAIGRLVIESLGRELYGRLMRLIGVEEAAPVRAEDGFINDLVDNTICADLLDYLARDAFFCNVAIEGEYRFLRHLGICEHEGGRRLVVRLWKEGKSAPRRDVLSELIRLLDNRYLMSERVYYHHAKMVSGAMVAGAVGRALRAGELSEDALCEMGDDVLLWRLGRAADPATARLARALSERRLWKPVAERTRGHVLAEQQVTRSVDVLGALMADFHYDAPGRMAREDRLAGLLDLAPGDLLFHCPHHQMAMKLAEILVFWNGSLRPLKECSDDELVGAKLRSILDSHQRLWALSVYLNPERMERAGAVVEACEGQFTFEPARRERQARQFYRGVLERLTRERGMGVELAQAERAVRIEAALEQLLPEDEAQRSRETADAILERAFGPPSA